MGRSVRRARWLLAAALLVIPGVAGLSSVPHATAATTTTTYSATETIPVPPASAYAGGGGGDGWAVALSGSDVYNVFHHSGILQVACHRQSDASQCWNPETITDSSGDNFATSGQPGLWLDQPTGHLYVYATRTSDATGGVVCIDTAAAATNPNPFCGFTALTAVGDAPVDSGISFISDPIVVGSRWYAFNYVNGAASPAGTQNTLLCFDLTTFSACASQPYTVSTGAGTVSDGDFPPPETAAIGSKVIIPITLGSSDELACFDATSGANCAGSWPLSLGFSYDSSYGAPFPLMTPGGAIDGVCLPTGTDPCYGLDGSSAATPAGMAAVIPATSGWNGPAFILGPRVYLPDGNSDQVECFDYSTGQSCTNFPSQLNNLGLLYTVNPDPQRPTCIWVNSDDGAAQIQNFDAYTAGGCGQGPIRVLASSLVVPTQLCIPTTYTSIQVLAPPPSAYTSGTVAFEDGDGNPISGTPTLPLDATGTAGLAGLNLNTAQGLPQFLITLNGASSNPSSVEVRLTWTGVADPSCVPHGQLAFTISPSFGALFSGPITNVPAAPGLDPSAAVSISWGDGSITQGTLSTTPSNPGQVTVNGAHTYWTPGAVPVQITITPANGSPSITLDGQATVQSTYAALGDSYSSGEGAGWPTGQDHPRLPGCSWQLYQDPAGNPSNTDFISGAQIGPVPTLGSDYCKTVGLSRPLSGNTCHRAITAYPHVVQRLLNVTGMTLQFVACSGAVTKDAFVPKSTNADPNGPRAGEGAQASQSSLGPNVSLITLTMAGNDLNFAGVAGNCVSDTLPNPLGNGPNDNFDCLGQDSTILSTMGYDTSGGKPHDGQFMPPNGSYQRVQQLGVTGPLNNAQLTAMATSHNGIQTLVKSDVHDALVELYRTLKAQAPGARILVLGYPHFFPAGGTGDYCEYFSNLEQQWVNDRIAVADSIIQDAAAESGVAQYVDVYNALTDSSGTNHQECTGQNIGGPNVDYSVDPSTGAVAPCTGNWINPIDVPAEAVAKLPGGIAVASPEILHPNPCGHQAEGTIAAKAYSNPPTPVDTFSVSAGQSHPTHLTLASGIGRLNLSVQWPTGLLGLTLTDPHGIVYQPVQQGPSSAGVGGSFPSLYATWDIPGPAAGQWTLTATNKTANDQGVVQGTVIEPPSKLIQMPPAGQITMASDSCFFTCTATFKATVANPLNSAVSSYSWFDDQGNPQSSSGTKGDTMTMTSFANCYRVILRTNSSNGQDRFSTLKAGPGC